jgi:MFS family permease
MMPLANSGLLRDVGLQDPVVILKTDAAQGGFEQTVTQLPLTAFMVGIALGQMIIGPLSDTLGRRRALLTGLAVYVAEGAVCAPLTAACCPGGCVALVSYVGGRLPL